MRFCPAPVPNGYNKALIRGNPYMETKVVNIEAFQVMDVRD